MDFFPLRRTKLYRPRTTRDLVGRPSVRELLDCVPDPWLTLICAPAGFGKTTLLNDWLENCSTPNAWLSLDEGDSDLGVFLTYFVAAVRTVFPFACAGTLQLLRGVALPPLARLVTELMQRKLLKHPETRTFDFIDCAAAHEAVEAGVVGKVVVRSPNR